MRFLALFLMASTWLSAEQNGLERLLEGNKRYVADKLEHPNRTSVRREALVSKQEPFAVIVGCSDSRVAPEIIFDQGIGDLFVVRLAGNVVGPLGLDSIEFAVLYLKATTVLVLGHEACGAVGAVLAGTTKDIEAIAEKIDPSLPKDRTGLTLNEAIRANAKGVKDNLLKSPVIGGLVKDGRVKVYAGYYNLESGKVDILD